MRNRRRVAPALAAALFAAGAASGSETDAERRIAAGILAGLSDPAVSDVAVGRCRIEIEIALSRIHACPAPGMVAARLLEIDLTEVAEVSASAVGDRGALLSFRFDRRTKRALDRIEAEDDVESAAAYRDAVRLCDGRHLRQAPSTTAHGLLLTGGAPPDLAREIGRYREGCRAD